VFGKAQRQILGVLRRLRKATAREVLEAMEAEGEKVAYSTVRTVLDRLHRKGVVERTSETYKGKDRHIYGYKDLADDYIDDLLSALYTTLGARGVVRLAERLEHVSEEDLESLRKRMEG
jgi:predicted transcriptional regulator